MRQLELVLTGCIMTAMAGCSSKSTSQGPSPAPPNGNSAKSDQEKLQGTWTIVSFHEEGKPIPEMKGQQIKIEADELSYLGAGGEKVKFKLDPAKSPRQIDLGSPGDEKTLPGIYEIDGDNLKLCLAVYKELKYAEPGGKIFKEEVVKGERPTGFGGKLTVVSILKRGEVVVKSDEDKYRKLIVGVWKWRGGGYPTFVLSGQIEFTADGKIRVRDNDRDSWKDRGVYKIDGDYIIATVPERVPIKKDVSEPVPPKFKDREYKHLIERLDQSAFETQYFRLERVK